jgi:hypothetical protein
MVAIAALDLLSAPSRNTVPELTVSPHASRLCGLANPLGWFVAVSDFGRSWPEPEFQQ